jgi:hypothetical protein
MNQIRAIMASSEMRYSEPLGFGVPHSRAWWVWVAWLLVAASARAQGGAIPETPVGIGRRLEQIVIPGPELEVVPHDDRKSPVRLRIVAVNPHGTAFRYDLEYQGLEPGSFDLKAYLRRKDGSALTDVPALPVKVVAILPPGQVEPNAPTLGRPPVTGGYLVAQIVMGAAWTAGLLAVLYFGFLRRKRAPISEEAARPKSLADRLKPLVDDAMAGRLSQPELARLERTLIAYWRRRLQLEGAEPEQAIVALRGHAEAGPLLEQLDTWLHRPGTAGSVDPVRLLTPYRHLPPDALEGASA